MDWRLIRVGLLLVALAAMLEAPPKLVYLEALVPMLGGEGSVLDTGPWGHSMLAKVLSEMGYRVEFSLYLYEPKPGERLGILVPGPRLCNATVLSARVSQWMSRGVDVRLVALVERRCGDLEAVEALLGGAVVVPRLQLRYMRYAAVPCSAPGGHVFFIGYTVWSLAWEPRGACNPLAYAIHEAEPVGVACNKSRVIVYGDEHLFSNTLLSTREARVAALLGYTLRVMGLEPGDTIIIPVEVYPRESFFKLPLPLIVHPAVLAAYAASRLPALEDSMLLVLSSFSPLAAPLLVASLVAAVLLAVSPRGGRAVRARVARLKRLEEVAGG